jgi:hypothetical protein
MAAEYHQKQVELLVVWALATSDLRLRLALTERALNLVARANFTDEKILSALQEILTTLTACKV